MIEYIITAEPQRTERLDYTLEAIRELVINMIVHRDYRDSSGSLIKVFDNRIEFFTPENYIVASLLPICLADIMLQNQEINL